MVLSDKHILHELLLGNLVITPILNAEKQIGSSSIDIRLGTEFRYLKIKRQTHFDLSQPPDILKAQMDTYSEVVHIKPNETFVLHPGDFTLASTLEYFIIPNYLSGRLEGRSTWGRSGLQIHSTAGFVDPGFEGRLTFELNNLGKLPLPLYPGIRIGQLSLHRMTSPSDSYLEKQGSGFGLQLGTKSSNFFSEYEYIKIKLSNMKKNEIPTSLASIILDDKYDEVFWYYQLGLFSNQEETVITKSINSDFYEKGREYYKSVLKRIATLFCDTELKKPKPQYDNTGNLIETVQLVFEALDDLGYEQVVASCIVALLMKKGLKYLCENS